MPLTHQKIMNKEKIKDTRPRARIILKYGEMFELNRHFDLVYNTTKKYIEGRAATPPAKARAKIVREYALNELGAFYEPKK